MSYAKLHGEMLASSIWSASDTTRLVWVTMLMMSDRDGMVRASLTGLAHQARVSVEACTAALKTLTGPDPESRDRTTGERVVEVVGGYQILNYEHYQDLCSADDRREKAALRQQRKRDRDRARHASSRRVTKSSQVTPSGSRSTHADADAQGKKRVAARPPDVSEEVWGEFTAHRGKFLVTALVLAGLRREAGLASLSLEQAMRTCVENGWRGFRADWLKSRANGKAPKPATHIQNLPIGTPSCGCAMCERYRTTKREGA